MTVYGKGDGIENMSFRNEIYEYIKGQDPEYLYALKGALICVPSFDELYYIAEMPRRQERGRGSRMKAPALTGLPTS